MSFQVTARRWRPQTFEDVVGQKHVTDTIKGAIENDRVPHAYLFAGMRGVGKTTTARILAKALNCENGPSTEPCNTCVMCEEVTKGISLDVMEIDGASNRGIEEIRNLRDNVKFASATGRYKVYIIDEVHMLTIHAFNALLKTLEEPPARVVFVMATTELVKVPATIVSRCQRFDFKSIPQQQLKEQLEKIVDHDSLELPGAALEIVARSAGGSMRDAQSLLDQLVSFSGGKVTAEDVMAVLGMVDYDVLSICVDALTEGDAATLLKQVHDLRVNGRDIRRFCSQLLQYLRDLVILKVVGEEAILPEVPQEQRADMVKQSGAMRVERLQVLFSMLAKAESEMVRSSYPDLIIEMALIKMSGAESFMPLGEILSRLEQLEAGAVGGGFSGAGEVNDEQSPYRSSISPGLKQPSESSGPLLGDSGHVGGLPEKRTPGETPPETLNEGIHYSAGGPAALAEDHSEEDLWRQILREAQKMDHLEQYLAQGRLASVGQNEVEIIFPEEDKFNVHLLDQLGKLPDLKEAVSRALGRKVNVRLNGAAINNKEEGGDKAETEEAVKPWNPVEEPIVRHMLNLFEGQIIKGDLG